MLTLDLGPGDTVVVPAVTFLATANAVRMTGAEVVLADVDPDTGLLTAATLAEALARGAKDGHSARAAVPVHLNGQLCDMPSLAKIALEQGLTVVEDACHALGAPQAGAVTHARMACFSTHPVKAITTAEGGVIVTASGSDAARMRRLRNHGMVRSSDLFSQRDLAFEGGENNPWYYEMVELGWNYRLPDVLCALGISQLKKLDRLHQRRADIAALYDRLLAPLAPLVRPVPHGPRAHGWHLYPVLFDFAALDLTRGRVMQELREAGIGTQVHYIPLHWQPYYRERYGDIRLPGAESYYERCLSIPMFPAMSNDDAIRVANAISRVVRGQEAA
jgi:dTDP-4-amino-4,6-dideoxygalactose transaminase